VKLVLALLASSACSIPSPTRPSAADPFRPRLRRRGAGLADERAAGPDPGQARDTSSSRSCSRRIRALPGLPGGELDGGTAPGLAVIFARAQGVDMKIVASICLEAAGKEWFSTTYMVKDDGPVRTAGTLEAVP